MLCLIGHSPFHVISIRYSTYADINVFLRLMGVFCFCVSMRCFDTKLPCTAQRFIHERGDEMVNTNTMEIAASQTLYYNQANSSLAIQVYQTSLN